MKFTTITLTAAVLLCGGCNQPWYAGGTSSTVTPYTDAHGTLLGLEAHDTGVFEDQMTYPWTTRTKWLFSTMVGLHYLDYETTRRLNFEEPINADGTGGHFNETNWLLGEHPSDSEVAILKGCVVLGTVLLGELFPEHRDIIFLCSGAIGGVAAGGNLRLYEQHK